MAGTLSQTGAVAPVKQTHPRPRGGTLVSAGLSIGFTALFATGVFLWAVPGAGPVLIVHLVLGLAFVAGLVPWLVPHIRQGLRKSGRPAFTQASWALLGLYALVLGSGLVQAVPALVWAGGIVWFPPYGLTETLSFAHNWGSWLAAGGLVLHLAMRHWA
jgi:hypothetical protein